MAINSTANLGLALPDQGEWDGTWGTNTNQQITTLIDSAVAGTTTLSVDADVTLTDANFVTNQSRQAILRWTASNGATTRNITAPARSKAYVVVNDGTGSIVLRGAGPTTGITIVAGERCVAAWAGSDFVKISTSVADGVTSVGGTGTVSGLTLTGTVTSTGNLTLGGTLAVLPSNFASQTANTFLAAPNGSSGVPTFRTLVAADVPTLNQNTTGTAAGLSSTLVVASGGTGRTSVPANNVVLGNGTSALQAVAPGTSGNLLTSDGTTWSSQPSNAGVILLSTSTISSPVAFVDITASPSTYVGLIINVTRMLGSVSLAEAQLNFLNTSGSPFVEFLKAARLTTGLSTVTSLATSSGTPIGLGALTLSTGSDFAVNIQINLQFNTPTVSPFTGTQCTYMASSMGDSKAFSGIVGADSNATQAGGIRLSFSSGNIVGGTIKVYGVRA